MQLLYKICPFIYNCIYNCIYKIIYIFIYIILYNFIFIYIYYFFPGTHLDIFGNKNKKE